MRKNRHIKILLILIFAAACLLYSCSTYKNGFLQTCSTENAQENFSEIDIDELIQKKEELNSESEAILNSIKNYRNKTHPIHAEDINSLFQNLKNQYKTDSCFQQIFAYSSNDSLKRLGWQNLIKAADFYNSNFQENQLVRKIINRGDQGYNVKPNTLLYSQKFLWQRKNQKQKKEQNINLKSSDKTKFNFIGQNRVDNLYGAFYTTFGFGSKLLGHVLKKAHFESNPEQNIKSLLPHLKKWDIVCMKSPKRLTDKFIPGYFGHVGIYLGNNIFAESIQNGVTYSTAHNFAEGNTFVIIRQKNITKKQNKRMSQILKAQIGKSYDFNFNIESPDKIFCTELIYLVYEQILWKTQNIAGHFTNSPDYYVLEALENTNLFIPLFIKKGQAELNPKRSFIKQLLPIAF